jgi:hypothetical protein
MASAAAAAWDQTHSVDALGLAHMHSMSHLLVALQTSLRTISTPLTYEQLQKNETVCKKFFFTLIFALDCG